MKNDYVTLLDVYATAISPALFEQLLIETGAQFNSAAWVSISKHDYKLCATEVGRYGFQFDRELDAFIAELTPELERTILAETDIEATVYEPMPTDEHKRLLLEAVDRSHWEHCKHLRPDIKTSGA